MSAASVEMSDQPRQRDRSVDPRWLRVGRLATLAAVASCLLMQWINHDWFPPKISVSQYGLGRWGWVFTCWTVLLAVAVLALTRGGPDLGVRRSRLVQGTLAVGCAGLLVMGIVRTDAGGVQHSWHARTHMIGSILALVALPIAIVLASAWASRSWRRATVTLTVSSIAALLRVLVSAFGVPTLGMGAPHAWAFWQSVAVSIDLALISVFALAGVGLPSTGAPTAVARKPVRRSMWKD